MKKRLATLFAAVIIMLGMAAGCIMTASAAEGEYAWVLVDTYRFPIPEYFKPGDPYSHYANMEGNTIEIQTTTPYGLGVYASKDYNNPADLHAKYTWSELPGVIKPSENVTIRLEQEVISNKTGNYSLRFSPFFKMDAADLKLGSATASKVNAKATYADGTPAKNFGVGYRQDEQSQQSFTADMTLQFRDKGSAGQKCALYVGVYGGSPGSVGVRYTYEWKQVEAAAPATPAAPTVATGGNSAEAFESGSRIMWQPVNCLGYRLFRSTSKSSLGISVTDFYITGTSYADVNVESNTTYYYTVKPVLAEAKPFEGAEEKLGNAIQTFTVKTGSKSYKPGSFKHFIMLQLDNPNMSVDGTSVEVDPGRGTAPITISGRTMVPIRSVVEAMGGLVEWEGSTQKVTLKARGNIVEMWVGKTDIKVNGAALKMDVPLTGRNGRTFVPVRFAAENLNCKVDWINSTKEAVIIYEE